MRKLIVAVLAMAGLLAVSPAAQATCQPGEITLKPKPSIRLPECHPYPQ